MRAGESLRMLQRRNDGDSPLTSPPRPGRTDRDPANDPSYDRIVVYVPGRGAPDPGVPRPGQGRRVRYQPPAAPPEALPALPRRTEAEGRHQSGEVRG